MTQTHSVPLARLFDLSGRAAIVTGGSRGLGLEMAEGLAEAGAALMLCARREQWLTPAVEALRARGFRVEGRVADVVKPEDAQAVVEAAVTAYGKVDVLVNNAGVSWGEEPERMPLEKWRSVLDTNLTGAFLFAQAAGREMLKRRAGCVINVASVAGLRSAVAGPHYAAYVASKAGLMGLTRELAATWGPQGIRVNAIAPGTVWTPMVEDLGAEARERRRRATPLGTEGTGWDVGWGAVYLASDESRWVTGQVLVIDAGLTVTTSEGRA